MNASSTTQKLHSLLCTFEQDSGHTIPSVTPLLHLYDDYCEWSRRNHLPEQDVGEFLLDLTLRGDCMPCRLPDGSVGVIGIALKETPFSGALQ